MDAVCLSEISIAAFIWIGDRYALEKGQYPCRRYLRLVQETAAPVSNCPLISSGLNGAIGCWLGMIEFRGSDLVGINRSF